MTETGARIISGQVLDQGGVVVRRREVEEFDRARRGVRAAKKEAGDILDQARRSAVEERDRGYAEGLEQAQQLAAAQAVALRAEAVRLRAAAGERLIRLAVQLAQRVLHQELSLRPEAIEGMARAALAQVSWVERVTLRLHPEDAARLASAHPRLAEALEPGAELRLEPDESLSQGSCVVETDAGEVDASVEVQLAALERGLLADGSDPPAQGDHEPDPSGDPTE